MDLSRADLHTIAGGAADRPLPDTHRSASALVVGSSAQTVSKSHQKLLLASGCIGNVEQYRVIPTPANPHGLDPRTETSIATALRRANYATGMSGKW